MLSGLRLGSSTEISTLGISKQKNLTFPERALRFVFCNYESPNKDLWKTAGIATLCVSRLTSAMCEIFKAVNDIGPEYLKKYFTLKDHVYESRTVMPLVVLKFKSVKFGKRSLSYDGAFLWNTIGNSFKLNEPLSDFKRQTLNCDGPPCQCESCFYVLWIGYNFI